jgi:hypothetical protein
MSRLVPAERCTTAIRADGWGNGRLVLKATPKKIIGPIFPLRRCRRPSTLDPTTTSGQQPTGLTQGHSPRVRANSLPESVPSAPAGQGLARGRPRLCRRERVRMFLCTGRCNFSVAVTHLPLEQLQRQRCASLKGNMRPFACPWLEFRVTRLGEFSPVGRLFAFAGFLITEVVLIFELHFPPTIMIMF